MLSRAARDHGDMREDHRPWPTPARPWRMAQTWRDLLFAHWRVPVDVLRAAVPAPLEIDTKDGDAWVGLVPFRMTGIRWRPLPPIPGTSAFPDMNLRTYVTYEGRPGVWFFTLDATNRLAIWTARTFFHLPYHRARMSVRHDGETVHYESERDALVFSGSYRPTGPVYEARTGDLDHWLTERYCLYSRSGDGRLFRGEILHAPWPLQPAVWDPAEWGTTLCPIPDEPPLLHFARRIDVRLWTLERVDGPA